jgi:DNA-binding NarL/FixJ family response regulator
MSATDLKRILIVDDDPTHLEIYGMIVEKAGFIPIRVLVRFAGLDPAPDEEIAAILLDYRLNSVKKAPEIAQELGAKHPNAPILVLSDFWTMPGDILPYASGFVRKGDPKQLIQALRQLFAPPETEGQTVSSQ